MMMRRKKNSWFRGGMRAAVIKAFKMVVEEKEVEEKQVEEKKDVEQKEEKEYLVEEAKDIQDAGITL